MTCMVVFAESTAMATTQLARALRSRVIQYQDAASWQMGRTDERAPRMNWVVDTDKDGKRRLEIRWELDVEN